MPNETGIIKDKQTGQFCSFYSISLPNCGWDTESNATEFTDLAAAETAAADMNVQAGTLDRFIGQNPKPR